MTTDRSQMHIVYAMVKGSGQFPIDMLRYDCCSPATEADSENICNIISQRVQPRNWAVCVKKVLYGKRRKRDSVFTAARWASFGCEIEEVKSAWVRTPIDLVVTADRGSKPEQAIIADKPRNQTTDGRIAIGSLVLVRTDALGDPYWDVVRGVFTQTILRQPHAPNEEVEALALTTRSWCKVSDVLSSVSIDP